jgi:hypothetical protein
MIATVRNGRLVVEDFTADYSEVEVLISVDPLASGARSDLAKFFANHGMDSVACSSSVDFPSEFGLPNFDAGEFIGEALTEAATVAACFVCGQVGHHHSICRASNGS